MKRLWFPVRIFGSYGHARKAIALRGLDLSHAKNGAPYGYQAAYNEEKLCNRG